MKAGSSIYMEPVILQEQPYGRPVLCTHREIGGEGNKCVRDATLDLWTWLSRETNELVGWFVSLELIPTEYLKLKKQRC